MVMLTLSVLVVSVLEGEIISIRRYGDVVEYARASMLERYAVSVGLTDCEGATTGRATIGVTELRARLT